MMLILNVTAHNGETTMKCTNCAKLVPDVANFCGYCGHPLKTVSLTSTASASRDHNAPVNFKAAAIARILKLIALVLMGLTATYSIYGAVLAILNVNVYLPIEQHVLNLILPIIIIALIFLARKKALIAAAILILPVALNFQNFLFSIPLILATLLLLACWMITRQQTNQIKV
jgi:zinc-ribbon domain